MANPARARSGRRPLTLVLGPRAARLLGGYALVAVYAWFMVRLVFPSATAALDLAASLLAVTGLIAAVAFFVCTYGVLANAPDDMLDEWQIAQRNRAYLSAFRWLVALVLLGAIGAEIATRLLRFEISISSMQNYLLLMLATAMVLPASFLAWRDSPLDRDAG